MARAVHKRSKSSPKLDLARSLSRVRVHSPSLRRKPASDPIERDQRIEFLSDGGSDDDGRLGGGYTEEEGGFNKVMVVVDSSIEAKGALEWALSHTIQTQDTIVLLHVAKPPKKGNKERNGKQNLRATELLHSMKNMCQMKKPGVRVEVEMVEEKEKGPTIVEQAKERQVTLMVVGQRKRSVMWRLMKRLSIRRRSSGGGAVEYCIQHAPCMAIAVRRKSNKLGGYLITTKSHRNFWLLA